MQLGKPFFHLEQTEWRLVKIENQERTFFRLVNQKPLAEIALKVRDWQPLFQKIEEWPPAFVDFLILDAKEVPALTAERLVKIMNSEGILAVNAQWLEYWEPLFTGTGFRSFGKVTHPQKGDYILFRKEVIPCCGS